MENNIDINKQIKSELFKNNLDEYFLSKLHAGGLYGLTIRDENFIPDLLKVIKLGLKNKKFKRVKNTYGFGQPWE